SQKVRSAPIGWTSSSTGRPSFPLVRKSSFLIIRPSWLQRLQPARLFAVGLDLRKGNRVIGPQDRGSHIGIVLLIGVDQTNVVFERFLHAARLREADAPHGERSQKQRVDDTLDRRIAGNACIVVVEVDVQPHEPYKVALL